MIQIWTFPAAPSTERVPSLAERVAYLRYSINLRLFNWRVPALVVGHIRVFMSSLSKNVAHIESFRLKVSVSLNLSMCLSMCLQQKVVPFFLSGHNSSAEKKRF